MKAILYFVAAGIVLPRHQDAAQAIAKETGKRVVFRNKDAADTEKPEANEGVAGKVPDNYGAFTQYGDTGKPKGKPKGKGDDSSNRAPGKPHSDSTSGTNAQPGTTERKLNDFGVPDEDGAPTDRDGLKECLTKEGIEFHGNAKTEALIGLYMGHFYPEG